MPFSKMLPVLLLLATLLPCSALEPIKLSDDQLRARIAGVWYTEELPSITRHIGQRTEYRPDGNFVSDYRISGPGSERCLRVIGTWKVGDGVFSETESAASDPEIKIPTLTRHVVALDVDHMIIVSLDETHQSEAWRGKAKTGTDQPTTTLPGAKALLDDLTSMHVGGYHDDPVGNRKVRSILDSRKLQEGSKTQPDSEKASR